MSDIHGTLFARQLADALDDALDAADPECHDPHLDAARDLLDRFNFWYAERHGQQRLDLAARRDEELANAIRHGLAQMLSTPVAAHGCHEEETE